MAQPLPEHIADELQDVHDQIMRLSVRVGFLLDRAGINQTPAAATPANVIDLTVYRAARGA